MREHSLAKVPIILAIGKREVENGSVALRRLGSKHQKVLATDAAIAAIVDEIETRAQPPAAQHSGA